MSRKNILFIRGVADRMDVHLSSVDENSNYIFRFDGNFNLFDYIPADNFQKTRLLLDATKEQEIKLAKFDAVFNLVCNADTHKVTLSKIDKLYKTFGDKFPFFNIPTNVEQTSKVQIPHLLNNIDGLHIPKTVQFSPLSPNDIYNTIEKEDFSLPLIIQAAYDDTIAPVLILNDKELFQTLAMNGQEYYLTEFIPYQLNEYYRKERLVVVNGEVFITDVQFSDSWCINDKSKITDTETNIMRHSVNNRFEREIKPAIQASIAEIYNKIGLDYFTLDCHIDQKNKIHLFKFNPDNDIFSVKQNYPFAKQLVQARQKLIDMITEKL